MKIAHFGTFDVENYGDLLFPLLLERRLGGEEVEFKLGIIGIEKYFHDSGTAATKVQLTPEWKQYTIDLSKKDLSCIKTGFMWVLGAKGQPVTFFLDDIRYE